MTVDEAVSEMSRAAGREFDPRVVEALVQVIADAKAVIAPTSSEKSPPA
jgi:response regulator RpfG family c-di-GMP phosphodiesterase